MREAISFQTGLPASAIGVDVKVILAEATSAEIDGLAQARTAEAELRKDVQERSSRLVKQLSSSWPSRRDIACLMGLSHQRVSQLANA